MGDISLHFSVAELACKHCGKCELDSRLVPALEQLRDVAGVSVRVNDAYRCAEHNAAVGGVPNSEHPLGMAADVVLEGKSLQEMYDLAKTVPDFENGGIGVYDANFIHVDVRLGRARWSRVGGQYKAVTELVIE